MTTSDRELESQPLRLSFDVDCSAEHAFDVWTGRLDSWWPRDHTVSGDPAEIVLQAGVGGRIVERTADGAEHVWGEVTRWEPPGVLAYRWHIGRDASFATDVEIRFVERDEASTRVEIEHRGWDHLADASVHRQQNVGGWTALIPHFQAAAGREQ